MQLLTVQKENKKMVTSATKIAETMIKELFKERIKLGNKATIKLLDNCIEQVYDYIINNLGCNDDHLIVIMEKIEKEYNLEMNYIIV